MADRDINASPNIYIFGPADFVSRKLHPPGVGEGVTI
jgi:hypothetical protein